MKYLSLGLHNVTELVEPFRQKPEFALELELALLRLLQLQGQGLAQCRLLSLISLQAFQLHGKVSGQPSRPHRRVSSRLRRLRAVPHLHEQLLLGL